MPSSGVIESHVALATRLILSAGHRVRIATHTKHRGLVVGGNRQLAGSRGKDGTRLEGRLEFFDVGGDPARLLPGLVGGESYTANNIISDSHRVVSED
jgi:sterol 3beta-glucosyltransferase